MNKIFAFGLVVLVVSITISSQVKSVASDQVPVPNIIYVNGM